MNKIDLDNFYVETFQLVRTMVVKIDAVAQRDQRVLEAANIPTSSDKTTWRYYQNLFGEYHHTDDVMIVNSLDTGDDIVFNKENLAIHLLTRREYLKGGTLYKRLTDEYQHQALLINGILDPIPLETSINAKNYKILRYNRTLVNPNEEQLIPDVQRWIYSEAPLMFENEYHISENLMMFKMVEELTCGIMQCIHLSRVKAIQTRYAHPFYIWSFIDGYGDFSVYKNSLTFEQLMWLHKNIDWAMSHSGQRHTFQRLVDVLLTPRKIALAEYDLVLNVENQIKNLKPTPMWRRTQINLNDNKLIEPKYFTTEQLIDKERPMAVDNDKMATIYRADAEFKGTYSLFSDLPTKVLESEMADYTNRHNDTLMSVVMNEWIYLAANDLYRINTSVTNPKDGRILRMTAKEAFLMWRYLTQKAQGYDLVELDDAFYHRAMKLVPPTIEELQHVGLSSKWVTYADAYTIREEFVSVNSFYSAEELIAYSVKVYQAMWNHKKIYSQYQDHMHRATIKNAANYMYVTGNVQLSDLGTYEALFQKYAVDFDEYETSELLDFAWVIFKTFTGWDLNTNPSLRSVQSDLIDLMMKLSSYTIHTVKTMDDGDTVYEMPTEFFIGSSALVGLGHELNANLDNVKFDNRFDTHIDASLTVEMKAPTTIKPKLESNAESIGRFPTSRVGRLVTEIGDGRATHRFPNSNYVKLDSSSTPLEE